MSLLSIYTPLVLRSVGVHNAHPELLSEVEPLCLLPLLFSQSCTAPHANVPVPHRFLEFCKENGGYTGCPFPAKLDLQQGQDLLQGLSKLSPSTSGMDGLWWSEGREEALLWKEEAKKTKYVSFSS